MPTTMMQNTQKPKNMKPTYIILSGLILMFAGFVIPRIIPSSLGLGIIFTLCYIVGLLMLIIGGIRQSRAKRKRE
jgi:hypothetical protein